MTNFQVLPPDVLPFKLSCQLPKAIFIGLKHDVINSAIFLQGLDLPNERMPPRKDAPSTPDEGLGSPAGAGRGTSPNQNNDSNHTATTT